MNLSEMKNRVMFQTNNDADDLGDFLPHLTDYLNEGYDRLVYAYCREHVSEDSDNYVPLKNDKSSPELPDWTHQAIADWATWQVYRNGNTQKQNRGYQYRSSFLEMEARLTSLSDEEKGFVDNAGNSTMTRYGKHFRNIPW